MSDVRVNSRSPYFIEANRAAPEPIVVPPPVEENTPPTVNINVSNSNPTLGETVFFTAVATDSDGTIVSYLWIGGDIDGETTESVFITNSTTAESQTYSVVVTDDDGDTASASVTIHWQAVVQQPPVTTDVYCGDIVNEGTWVGTKVYNLVGVGNKVGEVKIKFLEGIETNQNVPINFFLEWDGNTSTTGYIGDSDLDNAILAYGVSEVDLNTASPTNKTFPTTLTLNKTAATPEQVTLTAISAFANDSYSFQLICPDPEIVETKYYTLVSNDPSSDVVFTYTDVNGDSQTVTLTEDGQSQLISAQTDSVVNTSGIGEITEGGLSFDLGVPELEFDALTELVIIFDNSGSMNETLAPLTSMANNILKDKLIEYYNNDIAEYNKRVVMLAASDFINKNLSEDLSYESQQDRERFIKMASFGKINPDSTRSVYIFFQDEANLSYQVAGFPTQDSSYDSTFNYYGEPTAYHDDLSEYRTFLNSSTYGSHFMKLFAVNSAETFETQFLRNIFSGQEGFNGSKGLSDRSECSIHPDLLINGVSYSSNPNYYYDYVIQALQGYGFKI